MPGCFEYITSGDTEHVRWRPLSELMGGRMGGQEFLEHIHITLTGSVLGLRVGN
jgi:hypothetical protein